jgi:hypothetical protein
MDMAQSMKVPLVPIMSKELTDITFSGEWITTDYDPERYDKTVTPFSMISPESDLGKRIIQRNKEYDAMSNNKTAPTPPEARNFLTNEVLLIGILDDLDRYLTMLKVYLAVFGDTQHGKAYREFYDIKWNYLFRLLMSPTKIIPRTVTEPYLTLACYVSHMMSGYFRGLLMGWTESPPTFCTTTETAIDLANEYLGKLGPATAPLGMGCGNATAPSGR